MLVTRINPITRNVAEFSPCLAYRYSLLRWINQADLFVCAWGADGGHLGRQAEVLKLLEGRTLHCLKVTKEGFPGHPLYLAKKLQPIEFPRATP